MLSPLFILEAKSKGLHHMLLLSFFFFLFEASSFLPRWNGETAAGTERGWKRKWLNLFAIRYAYAVPHSHACFLLPYTCLYMFPRVLLLTALIWYIFALFWWHMMIRSSDDSYSDVDHIYTYMLHICFCCFLRYTFAFCYHIPPAVICLRYMFASICYVLCRRYCFCAFVWYCFFRHASCFSQPCCLFMLCLCFLRPLRSPYILASFLIFAASPVSALFSCCSCLFMIW